MVTLEKLPSMFYANGAVHYSIDYPARVRAEDERKAGVSCRKFDLHMARRREGVGSDLEAAYAVLGSINARREFLAGLS